MLEKIYAEYRASVPEKLKLLEDLIIEVKKTGSEDTLKQLRMQIHKITGNAGTYGFTNVSEICKEFTTILHKKTETINQSKTDPTWGDDFDIYLKKIKEGFFNDDNTPN